MSARIFRPAKTSMQSGTAKTGNWVLEFEQASPRVVEPLMGWTSSSDMRQQLSLKFPTKEDAVAYAEKNGIAYRIIEPHDPTRRGLSYSDNFRYDRVGLWTH